jgi:hypothetical protein
MRTPKCFVLLDDSRRQRAIDSVLSAPDGWIVSINERGRTVPQNSKLHALLTDVGEAIGWKFNGQTVDLDDIKTIFVAAYRKAQQKEMRMLVGIDGQPVLCNWRSRDLLKHEMSELIEYINAWYAENV